VSTRSTHPQGAQPQPRPEHPSCRGYVNRIPQSTVMRATKDVPTCHNLAKYGRLRPLSPKPYEARLDLSHLSSPRRAVPLTSFYLSCKGREERWVDTFSTPTRTGRMHQVQEHNIPSDCLVLGQSTTSVLVFVEEQLLFSSNQVRPRICILYFL